MKPLPCFILLLSTLMSTSLLACDSLKEEWALIPYTPLNTIFTTLFNDDLRRSWETQKKDLTLQDHSDPMHYLFYESLFKGSVSMPMFRVLKDGLPVGSLLGTVHQLPFTCIAEHQQEAILSHHTLVSETGIPTPKTLESLINWGMLQPAKKKRGTFSFSLSPALETHLYHVLQHVDFSRYDIEQHLRDLSPFGAYIMYISAFNATGMDNYLERSFSHVYGLETDQSRMEITDSECPIPIELGSRDMTTQKLESKLSIPFNSPFYFFVNPHDLVWQIDEIIRGPDINNPSDPNVKRTISWVPDIVKHLKSDTNPLISVGAFHLYGHYGLLQLLTHQGYDIALWTNLEPVT